MACIKWPQHIASFFWAKCHPNKAFSLKGASTRTLKQSHFLPTTKPRPLNPLTKDLPRLYQLSTSRWCSDLCVTSIILCVCLPLLTRHFCHSCLVSFCYMSWVCAFTPWCEERGFLGLYDLLLFLHRPGHCLGRSSCPSNLLLLFLSWLWACWMSFLPCWPIKFITSSFGFPQTIYFTFTSYYALGFAGCHSCHVGPLDLLPLFLGFHGPFTLLLPFIVPMGLLAVILVILAHWIYYLFSWAFTAQLLCFCHLLCPQTFQLTFLPCWPIEFITSFLGFSRPIYFTFKSSTSLFLSPFPIFRLLLPLGFL